MALQERLRPRLREDLIHGLRLFDEATTLPLTLRSSATFPTGVLHLVYGPVDAAPEGGYEEATQHVPPER